MDLLEFKFLSILKFIFCIFSLKVCGTMYKWTNFVYGWQKRYFELENGVLIYYKSESEKHYGIRGLVALHVARLVVS